MFSDDCKFPLSGRLNADKDVNILRAVCEFGMETTNSVWHRVTRSRVHGSEGTVPSRLYRYMLEHVTTATG
jgi:hypothetical protein